jgi:hypothetical protein
MAVSATSMAAPGAADEIPYVLSDDRTLSLAFSLDGVFFRQTLSISPEIWPGSQLDRSCGTPPRYDLSHAGLLPQHPRQLSMSARRRMLHGRMADPD